MWWSLGVQSVAIGNGGTVRLGKILVVGPGEAGKSTLIRALSATAMNLAVRGRTVGMDHAMLWRGEHGLSLVGVPGQERFQAVREVLAEGARAVIWVHRLGRPVDHGTTTLVHHLSRKGVPFLVVENDDGEVHGPNGWRAANGLAAPVAVLRGNPVTSISFVDSVSAVLWTLVGPDSKMSRGG